MPMISDSVSVEVEITPREMGAIFAKMNSIEQAQFFDGLANEIAGWAKPACFQWQHLRDELAENYPGGWRAFRDLAEYADDI